MVPNESINRLRSAGAEWQALVCASPSLATRRAERRTSTSSRLGWRRSGCGEIFDAPKPAEQICLEFAACQVFRTRTSRSEISSEDRTISERSERAQRATLHRKNVAEIGCLRFDLVKGGKKIHCP